MAEAKKKTTTKAKTVKSEEPDVTKVALEAAQEEQTIIKEKRSKKAPESELSANAEAVYDATLDAAEEADNGSSKEDNPTSNEDDGQEVAEAKTTKAGKHSTKAQREAAEEEERLARKESNEEVADKPKLPIVPTRSRLERRAKGYRKSAEQLEIGKLYSVEEAVALAKATSHVKFDASVELHVNLNVDPRHADQNIRDNLVLPSGTGKKIIIAVLTDNAEEAKAAGADIAGNEDFLKQLDKGDMNFDILIATPQLMAKLGKYARTLGPRGLMPNPKSGTVTTDVNRAVAEAKAGRIEFRVDSTGIVHVAIGKVSFTPQQLNDNVQAILTSIKSNKPNSVKGVYFKSVHMTTTMGPSIAIDLASVN
jgi:large subunit ribosomal protein L1